MPCLGVKSRPIRFVGGSANHCTRRLVYVLFEVPARFCSATVVWAVDANRFW